MDHFDRRLLEIVQGDCTLSDSEMGRRISLSASAVRRRLTAMRRSGVIAAEVAVLGSEGQTGITVITSVAFERETPSVYDDFRARMRADPHVLQCYSVAGQADFILIVAAASLKAYEAWGESVLLSNDAIRRYDSYVAWSTTKFTTRRPVF